MTIAIYAWTYSHEGVAMIGGTVKRKHSLIEWIIYHVGSGKSKVPQVPLEKKEAIEDALKYFKREYKVSCVHKRDQLSGIG